MDKISEIKPRQGKIEVEGKIISKEEPRTFQKFGQTGRVCNAELEDDSGKIKLTLWNDEVDAVKVDDNVKITNGYCNEFQGEKQLTAGRFGKLEVLNGETVEKKSSKKKE
ncbi:DNA-binding protein [Candidatus Woesearchaeota archaeon]|nr:DNA-binding protein [Candidatus Woesearchaeota archaeon]